LSGVEYVNDPGLFPSPVSISQAVAVGGFVVASGQVPRRPDGSVPEGAEEQVELALSNLKAVLAAGGCALDDLIMLRAYVTDTEMLKAWREVRVPLLGQGRPAATTVVVVGLADERWRIEIEGVAWRAPGAS